MKIITQLRYLGLLFIFLIACKNDQTIVSLKITNPSSFNRQTEMVTLPLINYFRGNQTDAKNIAIFENERYVKRQIIDYDGDRKMDEVCFSLDFVKNESKIINLEYFSENAEEEKTILQTANIRFAETNPPHKELYAINRLKKEDSLSASAMFLLEGPAWENDNIGFRNYYDSRNIIDIIGKRTKKMILDDLTQEDLLLTEEAKWDFNLLDIGSSLGAGSLAIKIMDSIFRVDEPTKSSYRMISDGPIKGVIEFNHKNWIKSNQNLNIKHQITIKQATYYYDNTVIVTGIQDDAKLVTGVYSLYSDSLQIYTDYDDYILFATHIRPNNGNSFLGMGLMIKKSDFEKVLDDNMYAKQIKNSYKIAMNMYNNKPITYRFYAGWSEQDNRFSNPTYLMEQMKMDVRKLQNPIVVEIID